jgi:xanthine dehydrogenase accessory factor
VIRTAPVHEVLRIASDAMARGETVAMATVLRRSGSTPATPGQKLLWLYQQDRAIGTVGGGALELRVLADLRDLLIVGGNRLKTYKLGPELGMCCGGQVELLLEVAEGQMPCLIVGAGHVGRALAPVLAATNFLVRVCDSRADWAKPIETPSGVIQVEHREHDEKIEGSENGALDRGVLLVMTHDHNLDASVVEWGLRGQFTFIGGVGSRAKHARLLQRLEAKGIVPRLPIRMPVGLPIGARSPAEIAIAIAAELVAYRAKHLEQAPAGIVEAQHVIFDQ